MKRRVIAVGVALIILGIAISASATDNNGGSQIDAILDAKTIVLGDTVFNIADNALFFASDMQTKIDISRFKEGDRVGMIINPKGLIVEMWLSSE
jgi:hypothetical protein